MSFGPDCARPVAAAATTALRAGLGDAPRVGIARLADSADQKLLSRWRKDPHNPIQFGVGSPPCAFSGKIWRPREGGNWSMVCAVNSLGNAWARYTTADPTLHGPWHLADPSFATYHGDAATQPWPCAKSTDVPPCPVGSISAPSFLPLSPTPSADAEYTHMINAGGGRAYILGRYDPMTQKLNASGIIQSVESMGSGANWYVAGVNQQDGRILQVGFFEPRDGGLMYDWDYSLAQRSFTVLSLVRVLSYSAAHRKLLSNPPAELAALRNGSLFELSGVVMPGGQWRELLPTAEKRREGAAMDVTLAVALPKAAHQQAEFALHVLAADSPAGNFSRIAVAISAADAKGVRHGQLSMSLPRMEVNCTGKTNCPGMGPGTGWAPWGNLTAPFTLLPNETSVELRVLVDRSTVEAFAAGGRAVVSVRDFPLEAETAARIRNEGAAGTSLVLESARGWSMGCGWQAAPPLKHDDSPDASPLQWQSPADGAVCNSAAGLTLATASGTPLALTRQTCTLPKGVKLSPTSTTRADLQLATPGALELYFSPAWNSWSLSGAPLIFGSVAGTTFLYLQNVNSTGAFLDACPIPNWARVMRPVFPAAALAWKVGAPGVSPCNVSNVSEVGWKPPLPATNIELLTDLRVSDGVLLTMAGVPSNATQRAAIFLEMHSVLLPLLVPPEHDQLQVDDWASLATKSERDLRRNGSQVVFQGHHLLRSYYNDGRAGGESVTQLDVLEPLRRWNSSCALHKTLTSSMRAVSFYHSEIGCIADSPASDIMGNTSVLDGWYVLNPAIKLAEMAAGGDVWAKDLLLKSIDHLIFLARSLKYVWPVRYNPVTLEPLPPPNGGEERSDVYGFMYLMMRTHELTSNDTLLQEALAVHGTKGALHRGEFFCLYERPFLEWGALSLLMLSNVTGNASFATEALQPLAYTLPSIGTYQAESGYRHALPTFMQVSAMRSAYSACFETHHTLHYLHRILQVSASLPDGLPKHVVATVKTVIKYALGYSRFAYPDKLPAFALSPIARPAGPPGTKHGEDFFNFTNDRSISVPVEDYWGSVSHVGSSPWTGDQPYLPLDALIPLGSIGQEIYGAGMAFEAALLAPVYGSATAAHPADLNTTWQLTRRVLRMAAGSSTAVDIWPPVDAAAAAKGSVVVQGDALVHATMRYDAASGCAQVVVALGPGAKAGRLEAVLWASLGAMPARPLRVVVEVE